MSFVCQDLVVRFEAQMVVLEEGSKAATEFVVAACLAGRIGSDECAGLLLELIEFC